MSWDGGPALVNAVFRGMPAGIDDLLVKSGASVCVLYGRDAAGFSLDDYFNYPGELWAGEMTTLNPKGRPTAYFLGKNLELKPGGNLPELKSAIIKIARRGATLCAAWGFKIVYPSFGKPAWDHGDWVAAWEAEKARLTHYPNRAEWLPSACDYHYEGRFAELAKHFPLSAKFVDKFVTGAGW